MYKANLSPTSVQFNKIWRSHFFENLILDQNRFLGNFWKILFWKILGAISETCGYRQTDKNTEKVDIIELVALADLEKEIKSILIFNKLTNKL